MRRDGIQDLSPTGIRVDAVARLTNRTDAGALVFDSRTDPMSDAETVAVAVYTPRVERDRFGGSNPSFKSDLHLMVYGYAKIADNESPADPDAYLADRIDRLETQILDALLRDRGWISSFEQVVRVETNQGRTVDGGRRQAQVEVEIVVRYTRKFPPTDFEHTLALAHFDVDTIEPGGGPDGVFEVSADINIEET